MKEECLDEVTITMFPPIPGIGVIEEDPVVEEDACGDPTPPVPTPDEKDDTIVISIAPKDPTDKISEMLQKVGIDIKASIKDALKRFKPVGTSSIS